MDFFKLSQTSVARANRVLFDYVLVITIQAQYYSVCVCETKANRNKSRQQLKKQSKYKGQANKCRHPRARLSQCIEQTVISRPINCFYVENNYSNASHCSLPK